MQPLHCLVTLVVALFRVVGMSSKIFSATSSVSIQHPKEQAGKNTAGAWGLGKVADCNLSCTHGNVAVTDSI